MKSVPALVFSAALFTMLAAGCANQPKHEAAAPKDPRPISTPAVPTAASTPTGPQYTAKCVTGFVKPTPLSNYGPGVTQYTNKLHSGRGHGNDAPAYELTVTNSGSSEIVIQSFSVTFTPSGSDQEQPGDMAAASSWAIPAGGTSSWLEISNMSYNGQGGPAEGQGNVGNNIVAAGFTNFPNNLQSCQANITLRG